MCAQPTIASRLCIVHHWLVSDKLAAFRPRIPKGSQKDPQALLAEKDHFVRGFTMKMLTYALGRSVGVTDRQTVDRASSNKSNLSRFVLPALCFLPIKRRPAWSGLGIG
jgi:uncharacterized protein DUF1585